MKDHIRSHFRSVQGFVSHHVVDVSERIVDSNNAAVSLRVGEGRAGNKATNAAEAVDSNGDGHVLQIKPNCQIQQIPRKQNK